jgi:hypothetical protein
MELDKKIQIKISQINNLFKSKKFNETISKCKKLLKEIPNNSYLLNIIGLSHQSLGNHLEAKNTFIKCLKYNPGNFSTMNNYAMALKSLHETIEAKKILENVIEKKPDYINALNNLANIHRESKDYNTAIKLYNRVLELDHEITIVHYNLALSYYGVKKTDLAIKHAKIINTIDPNFTQADRLINSITNYIDDNDGHLEKIEKKLKIQDLSDEQKIPLFFSLGKGYEDKKNYKKSFENYRLANEIKRKLIDYNFQNEEEKYNKISKLFRENKIKDLLTKNNYQKNIIFICGMPRSGTTLLEQIVSTHSKVFALEETDFLNQIIINENLLDKVSLIEKIESSKNEVFDNYTNLIKKFDTNKNILTDKSLFNFQYIGLIKVFFPDSKVIVLKRNFENNFLSIYKNYFQSENMKWTFNKDEIKKFYNLFNKYIDLWKEIYPSFFIEVEYEKLVTDNNKEIRRVIKFCDLNWEEDCLNYHKKNTSPISTASINQANKPIYKDSLNKYNFYKEFFE